MLAQKAKVGQSAQPGSSWPGQTEPRFDLGAGAVVLGSCAAGFSVNRERAADSKVGAQVWKGDPSNALIPCGQFIDFGIIIIIRKSMKEQKKRRRN